MRLHTFNKQFSPLKTRDINKFIAHFGGREEIQLSPLIAQQFLCSQKTLVSRVAYPFSYKAKVVQSRDDRCYRLLSTEFLEYFIKQWT
jgi:hypothetical protein